MSELSDCAERLIRRLGFFFFFFLLFASSVCSEDFGTINIASLLNNGDAIDEDRTVIYQEPSGQLCIRPYTDGGWKDLQQINVSVDARKNSPLAGGYEVDNDKDETRFNLLYLDEDNQVTQSSVWMPRDSPVPYGVQTWGFNVTSDRGIAQANLTSIYYVDSESHELMGLIDEGDAEGERPRKIGVKVAPGSTLSMAIAVDESDTSIAADFYLFYIAENHSLSYLKGDGVKWGKAQVAVEDFASDPEMGFAAAAWADPLEFHVFYIDEDRSPRELVFRDGDWVKSPEPLWKDRGNKAGEPVAVSSFLNGMEPAFKYYYASKRIIQDLIKVSPDASWRVGGLGAFPVSYPPGAPLSRPDQIALGTGLGLGLPTLILTAIAGFIGWRKYRRSDEKGTNGNANPHIA